MVVANWKPLLRQYAVVIAVNLGILNLAISLAWSSPVLPKLRDEINPVLDRPVTEREGSIITSVTILTSTITLALSAYLVDSIGRKSCFIIASIPRIVCFILCIIATDVWMLILARALNGISDGMMFTVVAIYASEIASKEIRGSLGTVLQVFMSLGNLVMLSMGPFLDYTTLNIVVLCICIVNTMPLILIPDSPYFLYKQGKPEEAEKILVYLRGSALEVDEELKDYSMVVDESAKINELVKSKSFVKAAGLALILGVGSAACGFSVITFYLQTILESTGSTLSSSIASVVIGVIQLAASIFAAFLVDVLGRRPILLVGITGMATGMTGLGTFFYLVDAGYEIVGFLNVLPLLSLIICVFFWSASVSTTLWPILAELFDGRGRAVGTNLGAVSSNVIVFLIVTYFARIAASIGPAAAYWILAGNSTLYLLYIYFCLPETKGKSFSEIQAMLKNKTNG